MAKCLVLHPSPRLWDAVFSISAFTNGEGRGCFLRLCSCPLCSSPWPSGNFFNSQLNQWQLRLSSLSRWFVKVSLFTAELLFDLAYWLVCVKCLTNIFSEQVECYRNISISFGSGADQTGYSEFSASLQGVFLFRHFSANLFWLIYIK